MPPSIPLCLPLVLFSLLLPRHTIAQEVAGKFDGVDSLARSVKYTGDIKNLTRQLTDPYEDKLSQLRSIFIWITNYIEYDFQFVNKEKEIKTPACSTGSVCEQQWRDWEKAYLHKILNNKKAICDGYARLFQKMCNMAGIQNEIITGYTKVKPYQIGTYVSVNHAWNAVRLDSAYYFFDPTWAAGACTEDEETGKLLKFTKQFNEYYWMTSFNDLSRNHYPQDGRWVMESNYTKEKFISSPYYAPWAIHRIKLIHPVSGIVESSVGDTLRFAIEYAGDVAAIQVNSNTDRSPSIWKKEKLKKNKNKNPFYVADPAMLEKQCYVLFQKNGKRYEFEYVINNSSIYYLDILFDFDRIMRFKVKVKS